MSRNHDLNGLAGEYYVLAQIAQRGLVGALTVGRAKGIDILVGNLTCETVHKVEVKTTCDEAGTDKVYGSGRFFKWRMSPKHELITDHCLIYCFVKLNGLGVLPRF